MVPGNDQQRDKGYLFQNPLYARGSVLARARGKGIRVDLIIWPSLAFIYLSRQRHRQSSASLVGDIFGASHMRSSISYEMELHI